MAGKLGSCKTEVSSLLRGGPVGQRSGSASEWAGLAQCRCVLRHQNVFLVIFTCHTVFLLLTSFSYL